MKNKLKNNLWQYIFHILSGILWAAAILLFFKSRGNYHSGDYEAQIEILAAARWYPACCIGAIISTAAAYFLSDLLDYIDKRGK